MARHAPANLRQPTRQAIRSFDQLFGQRAARGAAGPAEAWQRIGCHIADVSRPALPDLLDEAARRARRAGPQLKRAIGRHPWSTAGTALAVAAAVAFALASRRRG